MAVGEVMKSVNDVMKAVNRVYGKGTVSVGVLVKDVLRLPYWNILFGRNFARWFTVW